MKAPKAPDPMATATQQQQMNKDTAIAQSNLNSVNQVTPYGSLTYTTTGTNPDGTPIRTATTALSGDQQQILDQNTQFDKGVNRIALDQLGRIDTLLGTPVNLNNEAAEARLFELGNNRLEPLFNKRRSELETNLLNRGITMGSEAWNNSMKEFEQGRNDATNQLLLTGRNQAISELLQERNQPLNEISALINGGQVTMPSFVNTPQTGVSGVDYAGLVNSNFQNETNAYNAKVGGLFGLAGTALGGWGRSGFALPSLGGASSVGR